MMPTIIAPPKKASVREAVEDVSPGAAKPASATPYDAAKAGVRAFEWLPTSTIFEPLPPTKWIVPGLQFAPGRANMVVAFGGSGKTLSLQQLALAVAAGVPVWGHFAVERPMVVRHIDHEQGRRATSRRYQRLAMGMGISEHDLGGRLQLASFPSVYLNQPDAEDVYTRACDGVDLVILDALRGATPGEDENDSKIRACLDTLARISERTGTAFLVIHHAGKGDPSEKDPRTIGRGSGAIFDAVGSQFVIVGRKNAPKLVTHTKASVEGTGGEIDDFYLTIEDVDDGIDPHAGLRVVYRTTEEAKAIAREIDGSDESAEHDEIKGRIMDLLARERDLTNADVIAVRVHRKAKAVRTALADLQGKRIVVKRDGVFRLASDLRNEVDS